MKEFKFWAMPFSYKQLLLLGIPIWIILGSFMIFIDLERYFYHLFIFMIFWFIVIVPVFLLKRVKLVFSEDIIEIYYYGRLKHSTNIEGLECIIGTDIDKGKGATSLQFIFSDKRYTFIIMESSGAFSSHTSKQTEILKELAGKYNLEKIFYKDVFMDKAYMYTNPHYNPSLADRKHYNKSER